MPEILISPPVLRNTSGDMRLRTANIRRALNTVDEVIHSLDLTVFEGNRAVSLRARYNSIRDRILHWPDLLEKFSTDLENAASLFEKMDRQVSCVNHQAISSPTYYPQNTKQSSYLKKTINGLDDILKPIDWINRSHLATKEFDQALVEIGRFLNTTTGQRGFITTMTQLGNVLQGTSKVVGGVSNVLTLHDYEQYFAGNLTNAEVAKTLGNLVPVPILNTKIADWLSTNVSDPNGKWRGFVTPVE
jgi:uncharacterized protein YukE